MSDFDSFTDEEMIERIRDGEKAVTDILMNKYKGMVRQKAQSMYILGGDTDDLIQEGMLGLFKAVRDYDAGRDASFATFASLCVTRQIYTAVNGSTRKKHIPLNTSVSFYSDVAAERDSFGTAAGTTKLIDILESRDSDPQEMLIIREDIKRIEAEIEENLSPLEKQVLELQLTGMDYVEIAHVLSRSEKSIDNAIQRLRTKIRKIVDTVNNE